ncbi:hypothetical protein crov311 [Cafeteria roenbergensis virus]|uniref:Uncharacterized protein n=1 Tax=Cafeteria roenbergensis virus (strain BV-PW1) TaxID=693272 RepID=E3T582_CROVB|nr:hypothetical protein crov311 [Cafeteria roenbergensis virus BV-PW1]ADO67345.1 hypothetical protein crov311 [Cafeteria roenbergensis virus BV-PW1]
MSFNEIDEIVDNILDNFYQNIIKQNIYNQILKDANFVRYQNNILTFIEDFFNNNTITLSKHLKKNHDIIINIIKSIVYYYFFLGLSYYYKNGRDAFITNIIELSKNQAKSKVKITGFFTSNSNGLIIKNYDIVKNSLELTSHKTLEQIKNTITNSPIKYETTNKFIKDISIDFFINNIIDNPENFHILIKTIVIKNIYQLYERSNLLSIINEEQETEGEFRYITVVTAKLGKMVDYNVIEKMLTPSQIREGLATDIYNYILYYKDKTKLHLKDRENIIDYLFSEKILVPITEEFLKFHKKTEKYQKSDKSNKEDTKAKFIISKLKHIKKYYSEVVKSDPKKKLDVKNLFYTPLIDRLATLFNQTEDVKIINKLQQANNVDLTEILNDMENLTKYSYLNFDNFSKDGIKIRTSKPVQGVRYCNLSTKSNPNPTNKLLETRVGNDLLDMNVVGVMFLPEKDLPNLIERKKLVSVNDDSPYQDFLKKVEKEVLGKSSDKKYFWLFDTNKDKLDTTLYNDVSGGDIDKTISVFLEDFYDNYYQMILQKAKNLIKEKKISSFEDFYLLIDSLSSKYTNLTREPEIYNNLIKYFRQTAIKDLQITQDEIDNMIPNKNKNLIKLPIIKVPLAKQNIIYVEDTETKKIINQDYSQSICIHHLIWKDISSMRKTDIDNFNQRIFDFVKKYVKVNDSGEYICKSCDELLPIKKYVYAGSYVDEIDTFLTTSIAVNQNLERIPKYRIYNRTIKNVDRLIERIGLLGNFNILLGNTPIIKLRRRLIVKDTLDMVLAHNVTLSKIMKSRSEVEQRGRNALKNYNIDPAYSKVFFFELKDDIFLTSSEDTDKYKIVKYNNLLTYLILMIILEINSGQILGIKETKFYNFYFYEKFIPLFNKLKLRLSKTEIISIGKIPLFAYTIYIISGMISKDGIWFGTDKTKGVNVEAQKEIIYSVVDLINSIMEESFKKEKNFIYEIFTSRIINQIKSTYQDIRVFKMIEQEKKGNMIVNENKKLQYIEKKHTGIIVKNNKIKDIDLVDIKFEDVDFNRCYTEIRILKNKKMVNYGDYITGEYYEEKLNTQILSFLKKICARDKLENWEKNLCDKYGPLFDKKLDKKDMDFFLNNIKNTQTQKFIKDKLIEDKLIKKNKETLQRREEVTNRWKTLFSKETDLEAYQNKFIDNLIKVVGKKINTEILQINLDDNIFIIEHDYLGNPRKNKLTILESENLFTQENNNNLFGYDIPVMYFYDSQSRVYMYYHLISHQYLGYSVDKTKFQKLTPNNYLIVNYSVKNMIKLIGFKNKYERILDYVSKENLDKTDNNQIIQTILDRRINNLKTIIFKTNSIINQVKNQQNTQTNTKENDIIKQFISRINNFKDKNNEGKKGVFKNINYILDIKPDKIKGEFIMDYPGYIDTKIFDRFENNDSLLIFYLLSELNKLIEYNSNNKTIQSELAYLIISAIKYIFESYYEQNYSTHVQKFYFLTKLIDDDTMVDERVSFVGMYSELLHQEELENKEINEDIYDAEQETTALDIDDYDEDDDFAFDNEYDREIPDAMI